MRACLAVPFLAVVVGLAACGQEPGADSLSTTSMPTTTAVTTSSLPPSPSTTTTTSTTTSTSTTTPPPATTVPDLVYPNILRADGIGSVAFGTPFDEAMVALEPMLGPADSTYDEGGSDIYMSVEQMRKLTWEDVHLRLVFTDWNGDWVNPAAVPLHLADWEVFGPGLATTTGVGWGTTVGELKRAYPEVSIGINELAPAFFVDEGDDGIIHGVFNWPYEDFEDALEIALADQGFETLMDFRDAHELPDDTTVLEELGLPPDDIPVGWMHAGTGPLCC